MAPPTRKNSASSSVAILLSSDFVFIASSVGDLNWPNGYYMTVSLMTSSVRILESISLSDASNHGDARLGTVPVLGRVAHSCTQSCEPLAASSEMMLSFFGNEEIQARIDVTITNHVSVEGKFYWWVVKPSVGFKDRCHQGGARPHRPALHQAPGRQSCRIARGSQGQR